MLFGTTAKENVSVKLAFKYASMAAAFSAIPPAVTVHSTFVHARPANPDDAVGSRDMSSHEVNVGGVIKDTTGFGDRLGATIVNTAGSVKLYTEQSVLMTQAAFTTPPFTHTVSSMTGSAPLDAISATNAVVFCHLQSVIELPVKRTSSEQLNNDPKSLITVAPLSVSESNVNTNCVPALEKLTAEGIGTSGGVPALRMVTVMFNGL
mmetsp:Transcript_6342/g.10619  ORF Transcript_6342/g.10619 Transcript_6342/m.10619 type:complete len:207 (+) Transcript_6342:3760-4380(+)